MKVFFFTFLLLSSKISFGYSIGNPSIHGSLWGTEFVLHGTIVNKAYEYDRIYSVNHKNEKTGQYWDVTKSITYTVKIKSVLFGNYQQDEIDFMVYKDVFHESEVNVAVGENIVVFISKKKIDSKYFVDPSLILREMVFGNSKRLISLPWSVPVPKKEKSIPKHLLISQIARFKKRYHRYWLPNYSY